jgi:hypothetical protein
MKGRKCEIEEERKILRDQIALLEAQCDLRQEEYYRCPDQDKSRCCAEN